MFISVFRRLGQRQYAPDERAADGLDRRRYMRARVRTEVSVQVRGQSLKGYVEDVSISGIMLSLPLVLEIGEPVRVILEHLSVPIDATVVRQADDGFGLAFDDPSVGVLFAGWSRGRELEGISES